MTSHGDFVERLRPLVEHRQGCSQPPVRFRPDTWRPWLAPHQAARVLELGVEARSGRQGDRLISREDLITFRELAGDGPDGLRNLFAAVMVWGSGTTNGRGPRYTAAALADPRLPLILNETRRSVRAGDLSSAYSQFTLNGVGRPFFTKWFATVDDRGPECDRALILDARAFSSLNALRWYSWEAAGTNRWAARYVAYVQAMHQWAGSLGGSAAWLEWLLFDVKGNVDAP